MIDSSKQQTNKSALQRDFRNSEEKNMYAALWRKLPGPTWLKIIEALVLFVAVVAILFMFVFPWVVENTNLIDNTVG
ncbi:hypothetical protein [Arcanobacterium ihumii]|uniref:hypothetical protein n=1 Tax=Arcanobacterium ihumii TaxID=2138162 RepID=UPI0011CD8919|nr:hypothetical protein [Arcanobacterium ihumii]